MARRRRAHGEGSISERPDGRWQGRSILVAASTASDGGNRPTLRRRPMPLTCYVGSGAAQSMGSCSRRRRQQSRGSRRLVRDESRLLAAEHAP